jgi:hypothetical protein
MTNHTLESVLTLKTVYYRQIRDAKLANGGNYDFCAYRLLSVPREYCYSPFMLRVAPFQRGDSTSELDISCNVELFARFQQIALDRRSRRL